MYKYTFRLLMEGADIDDIYITVVAKDYGQGYRKFLEVKRVHSDFIMDKYIDMKLSKVEVVDI